MSALLPSQLHLGVIGERIRTDSELADELLFVKVLGSFSERASAAYFDLL